MEPMRELGPTIEALAQLDEALKRNFDVSLALATVDGELLYPDSDSDVLPADDVLRQMCSDVAADGGGVEGPLGSGGTAHAVPVSDGQKVVGALIGYTANGKTILPARAERPDLCALLAPFAAMIGDSSAKEAAIDDLSDELARRYEELTLVYELASNMEVQKGLEPALDNIFAAILERLEIDIIIVFRPGTEQRKMYCSPRLAEGLTREERDALYRLESHARAIVFCDGEPWVVNNLHTDARFSYVGGVCCHMLSVLIKISDDDVGVMTAMRRDGKERFFMGDVKLISTIGKQIAIVIRNARLFREVRSLFLNLVKSLISIVEAKHKYTKGHSERVHAISCFLGKQIGLRKHAREVLHWASLFHDVGKISVPDAILNKPGKLTEEEFDVVKQHPVVGYNVLSHIEQLHEALPGIRHHHEKMDGSGYPDGLKDDEIPLAARIIAVADVYDALTSTRSYRPAMPINKALEIMREGVGRHFDARVLQVFLRKHDEIAQMLDSTSDAAIAV